MNSTRRKNWEGFASAVAEHSDWQRFASEVASNALAASPTGMLCKHKISWTDRDGSTNAIETGFHYTPREARKNTLRSAIRMGWTRRRWWQYWRWSDQKVDLDFSSLSTDGT